MKSTREELVKHANAVGIEDQPGISDEEFQSLILDHLEQLPDSKDPKKPEPGTWDAVPKETQDWCNAIFTAEKESSDATVSDADAKKADGSKTSDKKKLDAAKAAAKKKSADVKHSSGGKLFRSGSGSEAIYNIVKEAMPNGITKEDVVEEAVKRKIKSTNIKVRAADVLKMCTVVKGQSYSGIMKLKDGLYFTTPESELKALRGEKAEAAKEDKPAAEKAEVAKEDKPGAEKAEAAKEDKPAAKASKTKGKGKAKGKGRSKK